MEHACQECWDNHRQLDELKEANELRRETIKVLNDLRYGGYETTEKKPQYEKTPYVPYVKPAGKGVIASEPRQRD